MMFNHILERTQLNIYRNDKDGVKFAKKPALFFTSCLDKVDPIGCNNSQAVFIVSYRISFGYFEDVVQIDYSLCAKYKHYYCSLAN